MKWCRSIVARRRWMKEIVRQEVVLGQLDKEAGTFERRIRA
jgi:hypothetical protein